MPLIYIDTCAFVAAFEATGGESRLLRRLFAVLATRSSLAVTSDITLAELLAPIERPGVMSVDERREVYLPLLETGGFVRFAPISRSVVLETVSLRAMHSQKLPDAIHIATAIVEGCRFFLSSDRDAKRAPQSLRWLTPTEESFAVIGTALDA